MSDRIEPNIHARELLSLLLVSAIRVRACLLSALHSACVKRAKNEPWHPSHGVATRSQRAEGRQKTSSDTRLSVRPS